jgi:hypothetical protein
MNDVGDADNVYNIDIEGVYVASGIVVIDTLVVGDELIVLVTPTVFVTDAETVFDFDIYPDEVNVILPLTLELILGLRVLVTLAVVVLLIECDKLDVRLMNAVELRKLERVGVFEAITDADIMDDNV